MNAAFREEQILSPELLLEESYKQISSLADAMPQLVWMAQPDGRVIYYNSRVQEFAGAEKDTAGTWTWQGLLHPEDVELTNRAWNNAVHNRTVYEKEHRVQMKDGSYRWHLSRAFPQKNEQDQVVRWFGTATDIHEQKLVEEKIKEAEARWRITLEATEIGTWEYDPADKTFFLSDVARKIRGLGAGMDRPFQMQRDTIHPDDVERVVEAMDLAIARADEQPFAMEYRVYKKEEGKWCWLRSIGKAITEENGKPRRVIGILQDITERKGIEEQLQYLAALTQNIADAVIGTNLDHNITNWNRGAEEIYGWKKEEVLGKSAREVLQNQFFSDFDKQAWQEQFNTIGHWQGEVLQKRKDGSLITVMVSIAKVKDGNDKHIGGVAVNKDITEKRKAEQLLKESEEGFRVLTNTIPQIVWISGNDGKLHYLNDQWFNVTGQTIAEGLEKRHEMVHPADIALILGKWARALREGQAFHAEYRLKNKNTGEYRWFFGNIEPLKDKEGKVMKWIGAATDIQHFKDISVVLEKQVQERTTELNRLNATLQKQTEELRHSNEDLQQFAHVASHDLKEPLRKIKTYGSRLQDEFGDILPEKAKLFLAKMDSAASRMASMIDGVLGYSMLGATEQVMEEVDLNGLIHQIENDLEVVIQQKKATILYQDLPTIEASAILIYQLFYNLINNSLKFSKRDLAPVISISSEIIDGSIIGLSVLPDKTYVRISVKDNGIGFDQEHARAIFKTFARLNAKDKYEGTGLGLSLCQKIAQRHNGSISAKGVVNKGATFTVILPLKNSN